MSRRVRHDRRQLQPPRQDHEEEQQEMKSRQVRRRLHTTSRGPFHGREPLDMAEARREIAAALRTHRAAAAATRRSGDQQLPQLQQRQQEEQQQQVVLWQRPPVSCDAFFVSGHQLRDSPPADFTEAGAGTSCSSSSSTLRCLAPSPATIGGGTGRLACSLPARPLGLSLSFHSFAGSSVHDDARNNDDYFIKPSPESSCSVCASPLAAAAALSHGGSSQAPADAAAEHALSSRPVPLHPVLEGLYPIGERRGAEWSDDARAAADVATPAWWGDLLYQITEDRSGGGKLIALAGQEGGKQGIVTGSGKPDGVLEMEMHLAAATDDYYYHYCHPRDGDGDGDGEDITLPCMELGEIEGWDAEWFFSP